jgi:hypothetical protein
MQEVAPSLVQGLGRVGMSCFGIILLVVYMLGSGRFLCGTKGKLAPCVQLWGSFVAQFVDVAFSGASAGTPEQVGPVTAWWGQ